MRDIIGHRKQWQMLKKSFEKNRLAHAYLFYGPDKIGKKRVAIEFSKLLLCSQKDVLSKMNKDCYQVENLSHPDLIFIKPNRNKKHSIFIKSIRELKARLSRSAGNSGYKIAIIDEAHYLTYEAQSALLKILEEPQGRTVIILISEFPKLLLGTIRSRCQLIRFNFVEDEEMVNFIKQLTKTHIKTQEELKNLLWLINGRPGLLYEYMKSSTRLQEDKQLIKDIISLKEQPLFKRFEYAKKIKEPELAEKVLSVWLSYFRQLLISRENQEGFKYTGSQTSLWSEKELFKIINTLETIKRFLSTTNINQRLALEILLMEI